MIQIRQSVFETNSSSSHSLVYKANSRTGKPYLYTEEKYEETLYDFYGDDPKNGIMGLHFGSYQWEGDPCKNFRTKLAYLLTQSISGWGFTYYVDNDTKIEIKNTKDWNDVINNYVMKDKRVLKILDFIKKKVPNIKGFKFYWYNPTDESDLERAYDWYKERHNIINDTKIPDLDDPFFHDYKESGYEYAIGFGGVDHQSAGYLSGLKDLDTYLFDDNMWVIITNDNTW